MKYDAEVAAAVARVRSETGVDVDPALVQAVIQVETGHVGKGEAHNSTGNYYGPMNVRDSTARAHGVANPATLKDPATGIYHGTLSLAAMLRRFPGDVAAAISAYEGGPLNAVRHGGKLPNQDKVNTYLAVWNRYRRLVSSAVATPVGESLVAGGMVLLIASIAFLALRASRARAA